MRRSNWKLKIWFFLSVLVGVIAGVIAAIIVFSKHPEATGLLFFSVMTLIIVVMVLFGVKVLKIGEE